MKKYFYFHNIVEPARKYLILHESFLNDNILTFVKLKQMLHLAGITF